MVKFELPLRRTFVTFLANEVVETIASSGVVTGYTLENQSVIHKNSVTLLGYLPSQIYLLKCGLLYLRSRGFAEAGVTIGIAGERTKSGIVS